MLNPSDYRTCLTPRTFTHLREACQALADRQYFAAAVWGAVCLEALIDDYSTAAKLPPPGQDDLANRIQKLKEMSRCRPPKADVPDEIIKRFEDIRNIRNRLVHDTGAAKLTLSQDAQFIAAGLKVILDWYKATPHASAQAPPADAPAAPRPALVRMFLSTIKPHTPAQQYFLDEFAHQLREIGAEPVRFVDPLYDQRDPMGQVRETLKSCQGAVVVGLERTHAYFLRDKEGTPDQSEVTHRQYTSGWLHLEAGMANALGLAVFVLCQKGIHDDGIFDRRWNSYPVTEIDSLDASAPPVAAFLRHVRRWVEARAQAESARPG